MFLLLLPGKLMHSCLKSDLIGHSLYVVITFFTTIFFFAKLSFSSFQTRNLAGEVSPALFQKLEKSALILRKNALIVVIYGLIEIWNAI